MHACSNNQNIDFSLKISPHQNLGKLGSMILDYFCLIVKITVEKWNGLLEDEAYKRIHK